MLPPQRTHHSKVCTEGLPGGGLAICVGGGGPAQGLHQRIEHRQEHAKLAGGRKANVAHGQLLLLQVTAATVIADPVPGVPAIALI